MRAEPGNEASTQYLCQDDRQVGKTASLRRGETKKRKRRGPSTVQNPAGRSIQRVLYLLLKTRGGAMNEKFGCGNGASAYVARKSKEGSLKAKGTRGISVRGNVLILKNAQQRKEDTKKEARGHSNSAVRGERGREERETSSAAQSRECLYIIP